MLHLRCGHDLLLENAPRQIADLKREEARNEARAGKRVELRLDSKGNAREREEGIRAMRGIERRLLINGQYSLKLRRI